MLLVITNWKKKAIYLACGIIILCGLILFFTSGEEPVSSQDSEIEINTEYVEYEKQMLNQMNNELIEKEEVTSTTDEKINSGWLQSLIDKFKTEE